MYKGVLNFQGGQSTREHVGVGDEAMMEKCSGYTPEDGSLTPENVAEVVSTTGLGALTPEQTPFNIVEVSSTDPTLTRVRMCGRGADNKLKKVVLAPASDADLGDWDADGPAIDILADAIACKMNSQFILPTNPATTGLLAYEPGSATTQIRPLSIKDPSQYGINSPVVTPLGADPARLFDNEDGNLWTSTDVAKYTAASLANKTTLTINSGHSGGAAKMFTKSLGVTGVDLSEISYLLMDIYIADDVQNYLTTGLFPNDSSMQSSGYELRFYSDEACNTEVGSARIPRMLHDRLIHRVMLRIPENLGTVKGIALWSSSIPNFVAPASGETFTLALYSEDFIDDWSHIGNMLLPDVQFSPADLNLATQFSALTDAASEVGIDSAVLNNIVTNPGFETYTGNYSYPAQLVCPDWTITNGNYSGGSYGTPHGGKNMAIIDKTTSLVHAAIPIVAGKSYDFAFYGMPKYLAIKAVISFDTGAPVTVLSSIWNGSSSLAWEQIKLRFKAPTAATSATITITLDGATQYTSTYAKVDDFSLCAVDQTYPGAAIVMQYWSEGVAQRTPGNSYIQYKYCLCAKDLLAAGKLWKYMTSNPSDQSPADAEIPIFADPCRDYQIDITLPGVDGARFDDDYGDYAAYVLLYRRIYDGATSYWNDWKIVDSIAISKFTGNGDTYSFIDTGVTGETAPQGVDVPKVVEITNDWLDNGRYVMYADGRAYVGCLSWDVATGTWKRPTAIAVSSYDKHWAFPTTVDSESSSAEGSELDGYAEKGSIIRGMLSRGNDKYIFLDNEFFLLRGSDPIQGWTFTRIDSIGCISSRTIADCRSKIIWHDGNYFYSYAGGVAEPISRFKIDSSIIDWTKPHNAIYVDETYFFFCIGTDSVPRLMMLDIASGAWRVRESANLDLVGICTAESLVLGLSDTGYAIDLFGSDSTDAGAATVREVWSQYFVIANPQEDVLVKQLVIEAETDEEAGVTLEVTLNAQGKKNGTKTANLLITHDATRHILHTNLFGNAFQIKIKYTGSKPPKIHSIGMIHDGVQR